MRNLMNWFSSQTRSNRLIILALALALLLLLGTSFSQNNQNYEFKVPEAVSQVELQNLGQVYVHVAGEVNSPGLYQLDAGARVEDAIAIAGGMTSDAFQQSVNLARMVSDGEQIVVLAKGQIAQGSSSGFISLNSATQDQLEDLPGVGPSLASAILEYRNTIGSFSDLNQLNEITGIGPKLYAKITAQLTL